MKAAKPLPTRTLKTTPQLKVIPGALSLYREGDVITFDLEGVEFSEPIECVELASDGEPLLQVTVTLGVCAHHVKRVERRAS